MAAGASLSITTSATAPPKPRHHPQAAIREALSPYGTMLEVGVHASLPAAWLRYAEEG